MTPDREGITSEEQARLQGLPAETSPPDDLEERVLARLEREGLLGAGPAGAAPRMGAGRGWARGLAAAALLVLALGAAFWAGRRSAPLPGTEPGFLLALHEGPEFEAFTESNYGARYEEYNRWIAGLRSDDRFVTGLPLDSTGVMVVPGGGGAVVEDRFAETGDGWIDGLFVIRASDYDEAVQIARSAPHLRYRGRVAVRRISPI